MEKLFFSSLTLFVLEHVNELLHLSIFSFTVGRIIPLRSTNKTAMIIQYMKSLLFLNSMLSNILQGNTLHAGFLHQYSNSGELANDKGFYCAVVIVRQTKLFKS